MDKTFVTVADWKNATGATNFFKPETSNEWLEPVSDEEYDKLGE